MSQITLKRNGCWYQVTVDSRPLPQGTFLISNEQFTEQEAQCLADAVMAKTNLSLLRSGHGGHALVKMPDGSACWVFVACDTSFGHPLSLAIELPTRPGASSTGDKIRTGDPSTFADYKKTNVRF